MKTIISLAVCFVIACAAAVYASTVTFSVPTGTMYLDRYGNSYTPDGNGYIYLPSSDYDDAVKAGFTPVTNYGSAVSVTCTKGTTVVVPNSGAAPQHGAVYACYSTNKGFYINKY